MVKLPESLHDLDAFLQLPEFSPPFEFLGGRIIQKMSPNRNHGLLQIALGAHLLEFVRTNRLGMIYSELRCTFGGDSYIPDLCFIAKGRIPRNSKGELASKIRFAPDLAIEILSPGQTVGEITTKLRDAIQHGLKLGWLIHPIKQQVYVVRPTRRIEILKIGSELTGEEVLKGYRLSLEELFSWQAED